MYFPKTSESKDSPMSDQTGSFAPPGSASQAQASTTDVARDQAANVGRSAGEAGSHVAQTATEQAQVVIAETTRQARDLVGEAGGQAREQAAAQQQKAAQQLRTVADELAEMADKGGQSGLATEVARQAADRMHGAAGWLEKREPADLMHAVRDFARRRPGTFLVGAAVAGLAVGRLTRGLTAAAQSDPETGPQQPELEPEPRVAIPPAAFTPSPVGEPGLAEPRVVSAYPGTPGYAASSTVPDPVASVSSPGVVSSLPGGATADDTGYAFPSEHPGGNGTGTEPAGRGNQDSGPESYRPGQP
jgi:hypothetical protein